MIRRTRNQHQHAVPKLLLVPLLLVFLLIACVTNVPPIANNQSLSTPEDTPLSITLDGTDANGDTLTYAIDTGPNHGTLTGTAPDVTYTPNPNYVGNDSFTFIVNDGTVDSAEAAISINVTSQNSPPTLIPPGDQTVIRNTLTPNNVSVTFEASDEDGDALTITAISNNQAVIPDADLDPSCTAGTCTLAFTPEASSDTLTTVNLTATDGIETASDSFDVIVTAQLVTNTDDSGAGSLRQVVQEAMFGDVIGFESDGAFATPRTITLTSGQITLDKPLTIEGPGQDNLSISGNQASRVFFITGDVSLQHLTLTDGYAPWSPPFPYIDSGGAVVVLLGRTGAYSFAMKHVTILNSAALDQGGGISIEGDFPLQRTSLGTIVSIEDSTISGNSTLSNDGTSGSGGGIFVTFQCRCDVSMSIRDSLISNNTAGHGGGVHGHRQRSGIIIDGSAVSGNTATQGGGIFSSGTVTLQNGSTVSGNTATFGGGGIYNDGGTLNGAVAGGNVSGNTPDDIAP